MAHRGPNARLRPWEERPLDGAHDGTSPRGWGGRDQRRRRAWRRPSSAIVEAIEYGVKTRGAGHLKHLHDVLRLLVASDGPTLHRRAAGDELQRRFSSGSDGTKPRGGDRRGKLRGNDRMLTGSAEQSLDGSGKAWGRRIDGRGPAAGGGRRRRCRAQGGFGFCRDDQGDEAELMACSGRGSYGQGHGQLQLELGSNGGSKEEEIREEEENRGREWIGEALGSLSPSSPARTGGQAGTQVGGRAGGGGGHLRARLGDR